MNCFWYHILIKRNIPLKSTRKSFFWSIFLFILKFFKNVYNVSQLVDDRQKNDEYWSWISSTYMYYGHYNFLFFAYRNSQTYKMHVKNPPNLNAALNPVRNRSNKIVSYLYLCKKKKNKGLLHELVKNYKTKFTHFLLYLTYLKFYNLFS